MDSITKYRFQPKFRSKIQRKNNVPTGVVTDLLMNVPTIENVCICSILPREILIKILMLMSRCEWMQCKLVCNFFYELIESMEVRFFQQFFKATHTGVLKLSRVYDYVWWLTYVNIEPIFLLYPKSVHRLTFDKCLHISCAKLPYDIRILEFNDTCFDILVLANFPHLTHLIIKYTNNKRQKCNIQGLGNFVVDARSETRNEKCTFTFQGNLEILDISTNISHKKRNDCCESPKKMLRMSLPVNA